MKTAVMTVMCAAALIVAGAAHPAEAGSSTAPADSVASPPREFRRGVPAHLTARGDSLGLNSPGAAARLSLVGTIVPYWGGLLLARDQSLEVAGRSLALGGMLIGPSLGYFHGGCTRRGLTGIAIRTALLGVTTVAAAHAEWPDLFGSDESGNAAFVITILGVCSLSAATIVDLVLVSRTVSRENERRVGEAAAISATAGLMAGAAGPMAGVRITF